MKISEAYQWEVEEPSGIIRQYNDDGSENSSSMIAITEIVRISIIPRVAGLPRHDVLINQEKGEKFVRRFGRGIMKNNGGYMLSEYLHCIETNRYRFWVFSSTGQSLVTNSEFEVYI
jgi:hypothetical protein